MFGWFRDREAERKRKEEERLRASLAKKVQALTIEGTDDDFDPTVVMDDTTGVYELEHTDSDIDWNGPCRYDVKELNEDDDDLNTLIRFMDEYNKTGAK